MTPLSVMKPYFQEQAVTEVLFFGTLAVWIALELRQQANRRSDATKMDQNSRWIFGFTWVAAIALANVLRSTDTGGSIPAGPVAFSIGLALLWAGVGLRWWCFRTLGRYFTFDVMTSPDQRVIDSGPYRVLRHPSYTALVLCFAGIGVQEANWLGLLAIILFPLVGLINRIRVEEAALSATLGDNYRSYAAGRKRLIPFVW